MKTQIFENYSAFLDREDKTLNGVSPRFAELNPDYEKENETNKACWNCSDCSDCSRCSRCSGCSGLESNAPAKIPEIPVIENIHSAVLAAATSAPDSLNMDKWHVCNTTHCRAGWVVHLAGEAGYALEAKTSTLFAAMQIYHASSPDIPVSPPRYYETNGVALADMQKCAELEKGGTV